MVDSNPIFQKIPHRPPFLWVDRILCQQQEQIETEKVIPLDLDLFKGHYPGYPILPGVILCEAVFQTGALLIAHLLEQNQQVVNGVPVVTRITKAKFKREVRPGDTIVMQVRLTEQVGPAWFMRGKVLVDNKTAVSLDFGCTLKVNK